MTPRIDAPELRLQWVSSPPSESQTGNYIDSLRFRVVKQDDSLVTWYDKQAFITITDSTGGERAYDARLKGDTLATPQAGMYRFDNIVIERAGIDYILMASSESALSDTSDVLTIEPGPPFAIDFEVVEIENDSLIKASSLVSRMESDKKTRRWTYIWNRWYL